MTRDTSNGDGSIGQSTEASDDDRHVYRVTGREQSLVGKYDIRLCRQSFRELAPAIGFEKYD